MVCSPHRIHPGALCSGGKRADWPVHHDGRRRGILLPFHALSESSHSNPGVAAGFRGGDKSQVSGSPGTSHSLEKSNTAPGRRGMSRCIQMDKWLRGREQEGEGGDGAEGGFDKRGVFTVSKPKVTQLPERNFPESSGFIS